MNGDRCFALGFFTLDSRKLAMLAGLFVLLPPVQGQTAAVPVPVELLRRVMAGGPYGAPWLIEGTGSTHFPVSCKPETQRWFDQGNTLLHSFWYYEARRSFRWALKLDPQCAIAYWALAQVRGVPEDLQRALIQEAAKRKHLASPRERLFIEAAEARFGLDALTEAPQGERMRAFQAKMDELLFEYPDDVEAKIFYSQFASGQGAEAIRQQVLAAEPEHAGAHHYRIHALEHRHAEQVLDSAQVLERTITGVGHTIHMAGHVMAALGRWHEAARSMDVANRVELAYIAAQRRMPFNSWNYGHNRNYLSYVQERLGMAEEAIRGAREMLRQPLNPESTDARRWRPRLVGKTALLRALATFERWQEILRPKSFPWTDDLTDRVARHYAEALAHISLGATDAARSRYALLTGFKDEVEKAGDFRLRQEHKIHVLEIQALLELAAGDKLKGFVTLTQAAEEEAAFRRRMNDPPLYPRFLYQVLGSTCLRERNPGLAVEAFTKALELVPNDGKSLAGLLSAYAELGEVQEAQKAYSRFLWVFAGADPNLPEWKVAERAAQKLKLRAEEAAGPEASDYIYPKGDLARYGPAVWTPFEIGMPRGTRDGACFNLAGNKGRNVLVAFVSDSDCGDCDEQLASLAEKESEWSAQGTDIVVVAGNDYESGRLPACQDADFAVHRQFGVWDDFEGVPLRATAIIDENGALFWIRYGHDAFVNVEFLTNELNHLNWIADG